MCQHCNEVVGAPLVHYLLDCPATVELRHLAGQHGFDPGGDRIQAAARMVRCASIRLDALVPILRDFDPPR